VSLERPRGNFRCAVAAMAIEGFYQHSVCPRGPVRLTEIFPPSLESRKRPISPVCRSQPKALPAAEPVPIGSNPLGAGRR
jgi:hypothetical protein